MNAATTEKPVASQIDAAVAAGAAGVAVLGLGTEVAKLSRAEQRQIVEWVAQDVAHVQAHAFCKAAIDF